MRGIMRPQHLLNKKEEESVRKINNREGGGKKMAENYLIYISISLYQLIKQDTSKFFGVNAMFLTLTSTVSIVLAKK